MYIDTYCTCGTQNVLSKLVLMINLNNLFFLSSTLPFVYKKEATDYKWQIN